MFVQVKGQVLFKGEIIINMQRISFKEKVVSAKPLDQKTSDLRETFLTLCRINLLKSWSPGVGGTLGETFLAHLS
jgi:hypothetical protein